MIVFLDKYYKSHNLNVLSEPPDIMNCSLLEMHTYYTSPTCPIKVIGN